MAFPAVYVVVSGSPASGKSTLAVPLAAELGLPLIAKDTIKEVLLDQLGTGDLDWSRRAGQASVSVLYALAAAARAAVLENVWHRAFALPQLRALAAPVIEVFCQCPAEVARSRFQARLAARHPGHHDGDRDYLTAWPSTEPLGIGPVIVVETTKPVDAAGVAARVRAQPGWPGGGLHNVTLYAAGGGEFDSMLAFYAALPGATVVYEEPGHLCCFDAGHGIAVCIHEAEPGRPARAHELYFWVDDETDDEVQLTDPQGNLVRLHRRRDPGQS